MRNRVSPGFVPRGDSSRGVCLGAKVGAVKIWGGGVERSIEDGLVRCRGRRSSTVEHRFCKPGVGSSSLPAGSIQCGMGNAECGMKGSASG